VCGWQEKRIERATSDAFLERISHVANTTIETETEQDFVQAVNRIYHDAAHPSHLNLPIIERD